MFANGTWSPYAGGQAAVLAVALLVTAFGLLMAGLRLRQPVGVARPGKAVGGLLIVMWVLALATLTVAVVTYDKAFAQYHGQAALGTLPPDRIAPITFLSALVTFVVIAVLSRGHGWKVALGSAFVGTAAAPFIFELPFDLIVMWRTYPAEPAVQFTLLYFLPLFLVELLTFSLLTLSPLPKLSSSTLYFLAAMFIVFSVWAAFGFAYPLRPLPYALNAVSKILSFAAAVTLFVPDWTVTSTSG